jgi:hypothetical protein
MLSKNNTYERLLKIGMDLSIWLLFGCDHSMIQSFVKRLIVTARRPFLEQNILLRMASTYSVNLLAERLGSNSAKNNTLASRTLLKKQTTCSNGCLILLLWLTQF